MLGWWLSERQCDGGGLNGRPEKQSDVCYSWWILASLCMLGCRHWIDSSALAAFILECQDRDDGGVADRPNNVPDVFHTFFGIGGLSLLGWFDQHAIEKPHRNIDPVFALPVDLVRSLNLSATVYKDADEQAALFATMPRPHLDVAPDASPPPAR